MIRQLWSNPPQHGARIVTTVLTSAALRAQWYDKLYTAAIMTAGRREHLTTMSQRVLAMRKALREALIAVGAPGNWDHIVNQRGLFTYSGLNGIVMRHA